jgi:spore maturation protein A
MMNYIWAIILLISIIYSFFTGNLSYLGDAITESSGEAVEFVLGLCGIMALWGGLMEIAERTGIILGFSKLLLPFTKLLFPKQKDPETLSTIIMSFMANIFGAGNSSTVFALRTMERLDEENHQRDVASNDMCTFAVVNMAFAPIFPLVTLQIRSSLGSDYPHSIVIPSVITAAITILVSFAACKYFERKSNDL